jgi:hypothetical protein
MSTEPQKQELVPVRSNRAELLERLKITDDGTTSLTTLIKAELVRRGLAKSELKEELNRILRGDIVQGHIDTEIRVATANGWTREIRYGKPSARDNKVRSIVVTYKEPVQSKVKQLSKGQVEQLLGGMDSALAKQVKEALEAKKMIKEDVIDIQGEVVQDPAPAEVK